MLAGDYDLAYQYANLLTWFQNVLLGDANLMYSQGKSLGGNMFVTYSYYVASPLNLLLGLFPRGDIEDFYFFVRLLRTALCGLTMALFLSKRFGSLARHSLCSRLELCVVSIQPYSSRQHYVA